MNSHFLNFKQSNKSQVFKYLYIKNNLNLKYINLLYFNVKMNK